METPNAPTSSLASWAPPHPLEFARLASVCGLAVRDRGLDPTLDAIAGRPGGLNPE